MTSFIGSMKSRVKRLCETSSGLGKVIRSHSSAICPLDSEGFQARRPNAYQLAWLNRFPHQSGLCPTLATPAMAETGAEAVSVATVDPAPSRYVSDFRHSSHNGARKTREEACPRYSMVIWNSGVTEVSSIRPKSGLNGSRGWKSTGPFFTWMLTLARNCPSRGANSSYAWRARSGLSGA